MVKENVEFDGVLAMRIKGTDLDTFKKKAESLGKPYPVLLREIIKAFNENRVKITPTNEQKESLKIYQK